MRHNELNEYGLRPRDMEILEMMAVMGGKTYMPVLTKTAFLHTAEQTARNRLQVLRKKKKLIRYKPTGLVNPKNAILFTEEGKRFASEVFGINVGDASISPVTTWHNIYEQITYYWLKKMGKDVERTIVHRWRKKGYHHTPDLAYKNQKGKYVYVEIELTKKRPDRYIDVFNRMVADDVGSVLYVFEDDRKMQVLGTKIPLWDKIYYTTIDNIVKGGEAGKLIAIKQADFLKSLG